MSSKLIHSQTPFFASMVVDAVLSLDQTDLDESLIGVKKVPGGGMQDSLFNTRSGIQEDVLLRRIRAATEIIQGSESSVS